MRIDCSEKHHAIFHFKLSDDIENPALKDEFQSKIGERTF